MRVQISHHPTDRRFVDRLSKRLWDIDVEARRDYLMQPDAPSSAAALDRELRKYDFLLAILSPSFLKDPWLSKEAVQGMLREQATAKPFVVPILAKSCPVPTWLPRSPIDFTDDFDAAFTKLEAHLASPRQVFVVMKFGDKGLDATYELVVKPVMKKYGLTAVRIDQVEDSGVITDQILRHIERSALVLADLTGERPNCYFEVGYAHALGKELILTIRRGEKIHFDMAGRRFIEWESDVDLRDALRRRLGALEELS